MQSLLPVMPGHLGWWGTQRCACCAGQECVAIASLPSVTVFSQVERGPVSCILSAVKPVSGKVGCDSSGLSLYHSQIIFNLLTSSQSSRTKWRSPSTCPTEVLTAAGQYCFQSGSMFSLRPVWEAGPAVVDAELRETMAFCWVDSRVPWLSCVEAWLPLLLAPLR